MIRLENIQKNYSEKPVLRDISFEVKKGSIYALLGTNGVGKTTTLKIISGLLNPTSGCVMIDGKELDSEQGGQLSADIGFVPDHAFLYDYLTGVEYLRFTAEMFQVPSQQANDYIDKMLEKLKLAQDGNQLIKTYSHGMKQKLSIAAALIHQPKILILDEPLTGIDLISGKTIRMLLREYVKKGNTVLLSTHLLELAHSLCDTIGIIHEGTFAAEYQSSKYSLEEIEELAESIYT
ncbi:ABC transporter ATP-binding protein [Bacillus spizizenii ATCC 6633 = JCM 2499]|uniref:Putative ABC-transporter ATP-binding protein n=1 Tax=Bacillus spizizenii (strain ATCC 23059 / NRRL B-14472 / W23) TaxID=655816 RepID=E0U009_BACSH|nr:ABC transporter ATP-binding protein [Bacillus spizizenii]QCJ18263.1 ABC transporter ATP-binding protein [Bacillus subtilis]ADM39166.1 putative ABC-transporter ATP-binding protein [Bacillus spizizenii str. W23]AJW84676.1 ABC transporter ATP-binding protein [Bacillus spizizenii]EFG92014.1 putative ABC-transporter ATP-binding protein [Bacillus spizizenii ATCC 6633 = JCM 2499]KFK77101.1 ABC transporter family protein [Bacillus spizizenii]